MAWLASNVSLPFLAPFLTFAEIQLGARVLHGAWQSVTMEEIRAMTLRDVPARLGELLVGTLIVAPSSALVGGGLTWLAVRFARRR